MRQFGILPTEFWSDPKIQGLPIPTRYIAAYLYAGPHTNAIGCFRLPLSYVCDDLGIAKRFVIKGVEELSAISFLRFDQASKYFAITNFLTARAKKWLANPNNRIAATRELNEIPDSVPYKKEISLQLIEIIGENTYGDSNGVVTPSGCRTHKGEGDGNGDGNGDLDSNRDRDRDAQRADASLQPSFSSNSFSSFPKSISFPLKDGTKLNIDAKDWNAWQSSFPYIVVQTRLIHHLEWFNKNPNKRMSLENTQKKLIEWLLKDNEEARKKSKNGNQYNSRPQQIIGSGVPLDPSDPMGVGYVE